MPDDTTKEQLTREASELREKLEQIEATIEGMPDDKSKDIPNMNDKYWYLTSDSTVNDTIWRGDEIDVKYLKVGNVFLTEAPAKKEEERRKLIAELKAEAGDFVPDWSDDDYKFYLIHIDKLGWSVEYWKHWHVNIGLPVFPTSEAVRAVIEKYGDRLNVLLD